MVSTELHLATMLKELGLFTPQIITTLSGHLYTKYQGRYLALFEFIEGSHPQPTYNNLIKIGQAIGQIHQCKPNITLNAYQPSPEDLFHTIQTLPSLEPSLANFFNSAILVTKNIPFDKLPHSLTHGDIFLDNLIETTDNKLYIIDFEEASFNNCLFDLSRAIIGCCTTKQKMVDIMLCKALLKGYSMQCSLTSTEKEYLYEYLIYAGLLSTFWRYEEFNIKRLHEGKNQIYKEWMLPTIQLIKMGKDHSEFSGVFSIFA